MSDTERIEMFESNSSSSDTFFATTPEMDKLWIEHKVYLDLTSHTHEDARFVPVESIDDQWIDDHFPTSYVVGKDTIKEMLGDAHAGKIGYDDKALVEALASYDLYTFESYRDIRNKRYVTYDNQFMIKDKSGELIPVVFIGNFGHD